MFSLAPVFGQDGKVRYFVGVQVDVSAKDMAPPTCALTHRLSRKLSLRPKSWRPQDDILPPAALCVAPRHSRDRVRVRAGGKTCACDSRRGWPLAHKRRFTHSQQGR